MKQYEARMGLEVHVELKTASKLFCGCRAAFGGTANTQVCPVCLGYPGALPVVNRHATELAVAIGLALGCDIARVSRFDRKNYFYPDNPQNYQITQWYLPIATNGSVSIETESGEKKIRIRQMHMEEDAGKLVHEDGQTRIDYNRSGIPLVEIVTEPDFSTGEEVIAFLEKLRLRIQYLGASDCRMQEGSLRVDVNLSVRECGSSALGVRTEMKNLNSFRSVLLAIEQEEKRQIAVLEAGGAIVQETRRWLEQENTSVAMRKKETAGEYRYFPDPDLPPLIVDRELLEKVAKKRPEFREEKIERYKAEYGLSGYDAVILTSSVQLATLFEETTAICKEPKEVSNWLMTETQRLLREQGQDAEDLSVAPEALATLIFYIKEGKINRTIAKEVYEKVFLERVDPETYIRANGLFMEESADILEETAWLVLKECKKSVEDYRAGKEKALGFLVGQMMKRLGGKANPAKVTEILRKCLQIDAAGKE